ncbi:hypothetical protein GQ44DRAFT_711436 [Phaeosphaeriaceae sp. PMI808]|nr:hypothetical protein GQ44DRAFT_711436 [Phaeosphaeriaceae sp. PMI808]
MLFKLYPKQVIKDSSESEAWKSSLWSMHQRTPNPALILQPTSAKQVAVALILCRTVQCKFAVKSGGHAAMKGASSIDNGLVIDLKNLNGVTLNEDKSTAFIGAGNKWDDVYKELEKHGLGVAGGRAGDVGVGGYTLGGGISFFASARGWGCDNIRNFEVVNASGEIIDVNYKSCPDLFWALRGGGSNFGVVTRFDYETFPQADVFAGNILYDHEQKDAVVGAFSAHYDNGDPKTATWLAFVNVKGRKMMSALAMYTDPHPDAEALKPYLSIPALHNGAKVRSIADMAREVADAAPNAKGYRQNYTNHTFRYDADFVSWLADTFWREVEPLAESFRIESAFIMCIQPYTKAAVALMRRNGGNCLPLKEEEGPYVNVLFPNAWSHEEDDIAIFNLVDKISELAITEGKRRGLHVDFVYMNYAGERQDALKGYGKENYDRLKSIAANYDPDGVFQTLMPGYFKFGGAPVS